MRGRTSCWCRPRRWPACTAAGGTPTSVVTPAGSRTPRLASSTNASQQEPIGLHAHAGHPRTLPPSAHRSDSRHPHRRGLPATAARRGAHEQRSSGRRGEGDRSQRKLESRARAALRLGAPLTSRKPSLASRPLSLLRRSGFRAARCGACSTVRLRPGSIAMSGCSSSGRRSSGAARQKGFNKRQHFGLGVRALSARSGCSTSHQRGFKCFTRPACPSDSLPSVSCAHFRSCTHFLLAPTCGAPSAQIWCLNRVGLRTSEAVWDCGARCAGRLRRSGR
jgi:hypothetical protein